MKDRKVKQSCLGMGMNRRDKVNREGEYGRCILYSFIKTEQ
jgi:hypothetical protein